MKISYSLKTLLATLAMGTVLGLGGCASTRLIDSDVQSFVGPVTPPANGTYRFERLPSQSAHTKQRDQLEALSSDALKKVGLLLDEAQPQLAIQVQLQVQQYVRTPPIPPRLGRLVMTPDGTLWQPVSPLLLESTWTRHRVSLVLRDIASNQIALESSAEFDGPWSDTLNLLPVILDAALQGYPTPPTGMRKVVIPLAPKDSKKP
jgi:hypothetical protein